MAKEANVRLTVNASGFSQTIDSLKTKTRAFAADVKKNFGDAFGAGAVNGIKSMGGALREVGAGIKSHIATAATLGGAVGFGSLVKGAISFRETMRDIEFQMNKNGKATVTWQGLMDEVHRAADETGQSSEDLARIMQGVFAATGNAEFSRAAIESVGHAAQASGQDINKLGEAAAVLQRKFGATAETLPDMLAVFVEKSDAGGLSLDALGAKFGLLAGEAADAGFEGADGLSSLLGMLEALDSRVGEKAEPALKKMFQVLKNGSKDLKGFEKELRGAGVNLKLGDKEGFEGKLRAILGNEKARKKFGEKLGGEQRVVFDELSKPFEEAFQRAKKGGAKTKDATEEGLKAFDAAMAEMAKRTLTSKNVLENSKAGQLEDPGVRLKKAIDKMAQAFQKPEMMQAIDDLAGMLPEFAKGMVKVLSFVTKHPLLTGGMLLGGKVAMAGAQGFAGEFAGKMTAKLKIEDKAAEMFSNLAGKTFMGHIEKSGGWAKVAGSFGMIAGAAIVAYQAGQQVIDQELDEHFKQRLKGTGAATEAESMVKHGVGSDAERKAAADALRAEINKMQKEGGPGLAADFFGSYASAFGDVEHPITEFNNRLKRMNEALAALEADTAKKKGDEAAKSLERVARAAAGAADAMANVQPPPGTPSGSSKGPPRPGNSGGGAGHVPTPG